MNYAGAETCQVDLSLLKIKAFLVHLTGLCYTPNVVITLKLS